MNSRRLSDEIYYEFRHRMYRYYEERRKERAIKRALKNLPEEVAYDPITAEYLNLVRNNNTLLKSRD